jgi:hypothetical protein
MPQPTAVLQIRVNAGPWVMGHGVQVQPGDTISLRAQSYAGWSSPAARWEFPAGAYPEGWTAPAGWSTGTDGSIYYLSDPTTSMAPPSFVMPDSTAVMAGIWGKWLPKLTVNGGGTGLVDEKIGIELLSQLGFTHTGLGEARQFDPVRSYLGGEQGNLVTLDTMLASGGGGGGLQLGGLAGQPCNANAGAAGGAITAAGSNHTHQIQVGSPVAIGTANSDGNAATLARSNHVHAHGNMVGGTLHAVATSMANGFISASDFVKLGGIETGAQVTSYAHIVTACAGAGVALGLNGQRMTNLGAATNPPDAVTLAQLQATATGFDLKIEARGASTTNQALAGALTEDGITYDDDDRYLAKNQTNPEENGLYIVDTTGPWSRAPDADSDAEVTPGMFVFVVEGTQNEQTGWALLTPGPIVLGTTPLVFTQIFGVGTIVAGDGIAQTGNTFDLDLADGSLVIAAGQVKVGVISAAQHGAQTDDSLHAIATNSTDGFIDAANWQAINERNDEPFPNVVTTYGNSGELTATCFRDGNGAAVPFTGLLRAPNNSLIIVANDSSANDTEILKFDSVNKLILGDQNRVANLDMHVKTGGAAVVKVNNVAQLTVNATTIGAHSKRITDVATPTASGDATSKTYVDSRTGFAFLSLNYADIVADAVAAQTFMFINIDNGSNGSGHVNNGSGAGCPAGAQALGCRVALTTPFAGGVGTTLIKASIGVAPGLKQFNNVGIDGSGLPTTTPQASFDNHDCGADIGSAFFQVYIEIVGGPDLTSLTAGVLVIRCYYIVPTLL